VRNRAVRHALIISLHAERRRPVERHADVRIQKREDR
jgi:hypothetical protein